jgi:hypothetical protein
MLEGFSLGSYLLLVGYTSRLCRQGKARVSREVASILDRLGNQRECVGTAYPEAVREGATVGQIFQYGPTAATGVGSPAWPAPP